MSIDSRVLLLDLKAQATKSNIMAQKKPNEAAELAIIMAEHTAVRTVGLEIIIRAIQA
jgi:hypothetical protein